MAGNLPEHCWTASNNVWTAQHIVFFLWNIVRKPSNNVSSLFNNVGSGKTMCGTRRTMYGAVSTLFQGFFDWKNGLEDGKRRSPGRIASCLDAFPLFGSENPHLQWKPGAGLGCLVCAKFQKWGPWPRRLSATPERNRGPPLPLSSGLSSSKNPGRNHPRRNSLGRHPRNSRSAKCRTDRNSHTLSGRRS